MYRWLLILPILCAVAADAPLPTGDGVIRGKLGRSEIVITTTSRLAGAIHSLTWNGREFIDSADHGRQLQSASNLDAGKPIRAETFNPTEAGSADDGAGPTSSSKLLHYIADGNRLQTTSRMAFWLAPGQKSGGHPARNATVLSNHTLTRRVVVGYRDLPQVIRYDVTFGVPIGETHNRAVFEAVTGYMPEAFSKFRTYDPKLRTLQPLSDGPGEQALPVVLSTPNGSHAMAIFTPDRAPEGQPGVGYGRFRFALEKVVKWNVVFRRIDVRGIEPGEYSFRCFVVVGDENMVIDGLGALHREFGR